MSWADQKSVEYTSVFTIHTKDGPLRRSRFSYKGKVPSTPYCTMTLKGATKIARDAGVVPCVIVETKVGFNENGGYFFHQTVSHRIDE